MGTMLSSLRWLEILFSLIFHMPSISCCIVFYKVNTKILASGLSVVMASIIDSAQVGFISGRVISENIHLAQELLRK